MKRLGNVAIVGVGLIGGSIGLALRQRNLAENVIGIGRRQVSLRIARAWGPSPIPRSILPKEWFRPIW